MTTLFGNVQGRTCLECGKFFCTRKGGVKKEMETMKEVETGKEELVREEAVAFQIEQNAFAGILRVFEKIDDASVLFTASKRALRLFANNGVVMAMAYINAGHFRKYSLSREHPFALNMSDLKAVFALTDKDDLVHFAKKNEAIIATSDDGFSMEFEITPGGKTVEVPEIDFPENLGGTINTRELYSVVKYAKEVAADFLKIQVEGNHLNLTFKRGKTLVEKSIPFSMSKFEGSPVGIYPTEDLYKILNGLAKAGDDVILLRMKNEDTPLKISFRKTLSGDRTIRGYALVAPMVKA